MTRNPLSKGVELQSRGNPRLAERFYRQALKDNPDDFDALYLLGVARAQQDDLAGAIRLLERAVEIDATSPVVLFNLANVLKLAGRYEQAIAVFERSLARGRSAQALAGLGDAHRALRRWPEAIGAYAAALALAPDDAECLGLLIEAKRSLCDWSDLERLERALVGLLRGGDRAIAPLVLLNVVDDPELHWRNARTFARSRYPASQAPPRQRRSRRGGSRGRIRLGYFSADFRAQATAYLAARLFELHDRARFEVIAVSHGPPTDDAMRRRLQAAFDRFVDLAGHTTGEMLPIVAALDLDIAVDLNGPAAGGRMGLFAARLAPVQVTYLYFPGTSGADFFDYTVVDPFVVPEATRPYFTEALAFLPCYQVNDDQRPIAEPAPTRAAAGLPDDAFVFCCFNAAHKLTPAMLGSWQRILGAVPGSVLWLMGESDAIERNLEAAAANLGLDSRRLVFARFAPLPEHLARHRAADLFLDTLPYNAHTAASDALWAGLPVLTCPGRSFASRVAGSLLHAVGLPELIASSLEEYERLAVDLARDPRRLGEIRARLAANRDGALLFDSAGFTRRFEAALEIMWEKHRRGSRPESFAVPV